MKTDGNSVRISGEKTIVLHTRAKTLKDNNVLVAESSDEGSSLQSFKGKKVTT